MEPPLEIEMGQIISHLDSRVRKIFKEFYLKKTNNVTITKKKKTLKNNEFYFPI